MDRVTEENIRAIERDITSRAVSVFGIKLHHLLFDTTNFFTFVDSFNNHAELPQRGHSKEGRDNLRILGMALLVTSDGHVPLFHHTYAGNQHDSITFGNVFEEISNRCKLLADAAIDITLIFDKGNNSEDNMDAVDNGHSHFVGSLVPTYHRNLLAIPREKMRRLKNEQLPDVWSYRTVQGCLEFSALYFVLLTNLSLMPSMKRWCAKSVNASRSLPSCKIDSMHRHGARSLRRMGRKKS